MRVVDLKCNHVARPLGFMMPAAVLTWKTVESAGKRQVAAQIEVSEDADFRRVIYDSGKSPEADSLCFVPDIGLRPRTRYFWRVGVWDDAGGCAQSDATWFETGKMGEAWAAKWINAADLEAPLLRAEFSAGEDVASARIYAGAVGQYELYVNGGPVSGEVFAPGYTNYDRWIQYQTYDVTELVIPGQNALGAMLGEGWSKMRPRIVPESAGCAGDRGRFFIMELRIAYRDGTEQVVSSGDHWKMSPGPLRRTSVYDGEVWDDNFRLPGWDEPGFDDGAWENAVRREPGLGALTERLSVPVKIMERIAPLGLIRTPAGELVLDMGQNMAGWLQMTLDLPKGAKLSVQFGEFLENGNFCNKNLMDGKQEFKFISSGHKRTVRQHFTYYGYRYAKLSGRVGGLRPEDFEGLVLYSELDVIGRIETSNPLVNKLFVNCLWSQKGNFIDNPSDCPQRSERLGWTGDAQVFCGTASFNMDTTAFYKKYLFDLNGEQPRFGGSVPHTVPSARGDMNGAAGWADAAAVIPWTVYLHSGDRHILADCFAGMKAWVDYVTSQTDERGLWMSGTHFGDWLGLDGIGMRGGTEDNYLANCYYFLSASITAKAAGLLGYLAECKRYRQLAEKIRRLIRCEYFTPFGKLANDTQTAAIYALLLDLCPEGKRGRIADMLGGLVERHNGELRTGFLGTPYICRMLSENGMNEQAYVMLTSTRQPGWLFPVVAGATTIWENWYALNENGEMDGVYSLNHYAYGAVAEWMYRDMLGIVPDENAPGFRHFFLTPRPNRHIRWAKGSVDTASGEIKSAWKINGDGSLSYRFEIPFNSTAALTLPDARAGDVSISGTSARLAQSGRTAVLELSAGHYDISYMPTENYVLTYGVWCTVEEVEQNPPALAALNHALSGMPPEMTEPLLRNKKRSLRQALNFSGPISSKPLIDRVDKLLSEIPYIW